MKIAHVSDIHIRNLKYHNEYRKVFEDLYRNLERLKPDIVINTGDTAHTKTQISPEFVEMTSEHIRKVSAIAPYHILLGNHDMNLMNPDRQDAITPIVDSLKSDRVFLHKKSGLAHTYKFGQNGQKYNLWAFSLADTKNYPTQSSWGSYRDDVNIGMFHGSITSCMTDMNWRMTHVEHDISIFDGLDFALLGDIHKQQFFSDKKIAYAGSLVQQNFGEEIDKGFLFWEIGEKGEDHSVKPVILSGGRKFFTIRLKEDLSCPDQKIDEGAHVRIVPPRQVTLVEQKDFEKEIKKKYKPHDIITLSPNNIGEQKITVGKKSSDVENLRQISVQEKLIREFLEEAKLSEDVLAKIIELNKKYQIDIDQEDQGARNISWGINKLGWSNLFNYGEANIIDFSRLGGLTGIFAPNGSGKSNLVDVILETCFDSTTKGVNKNIFLINDNKDTALSVAEIVANDTTYEIQRNIEKIKYGQRSDKVKEWGKTSVEFSLVDDLGDKQPLVGMSRHETESSIRQRLGTFDDFMLTSLMAQWNPMDIISAKETKRKEIIFKFLDLEMFGQKAVMAKDESREFVKKLSDLENDNVEEMIKEYRSIVAARNDTVLDLKRRISDLELEEKSFQDEVVFLTSQKLNIDRISVKDWSIRIVEKQNELSVIEQRVVATKKKIDDKLEEISKIDKLKSKFDFETHEKNDEQRKKLLADVEKLSSELKDKMIELKTHKDAAEELGELTCPACGEKIDSLKSSSAVISLEADIEDLENDISTKKGDAEMLLDFSQRLEDFKRFMQEKISLKASIENLKLQEEILRLSDENVREKIFRLEEEKRNYEQMELDIKKNDALDEQIREVQTRKNVITRKISNVQEEYVEEVRKLGLDSDALDKFESQMSQINDLKNTCEAYEHYVRAMGKDGIPYQVLTQKLPLINDEINKILSNVADFNVYLEHDVEEQSIRFFVKYGQYKSRLLELGSGAEKFLASIAIRNALLSISALPKTNMLIIDEGFGKLDPKNLESIQKMFDYLRTVFDHILVISHLDSMKDMVDNIIEITNDEEGYAHIEIGE